MFCLKIFLKKVSLSQLLFERSESKNNKKKLLLLVNDEGTNRIKTPSATNNRTFGLVNNIDDDYPNGRVEYQTRKCKTITIYNNNNNNNNSYYNSENNVDNNFKGNNHHLFSQVDFKRFLSPEASLIMILQPNATPEMTITNGASAVVSAVVMTPSSIPLIKNPKSTMIIIPFATTAVVLILKTTMITIRKATKLVPPIPPPSIATPIMPRREEVTRMMRCAYCVLSAIRMELYYVF